uniref:Uncharacterized protein n=1 Tax=Arundo donax TaxID=35708 RepID=A0A0A9BUL0_ARUDO
MVWITKKYHFHVLSSLANLLLDVSVWIIALWCSPQPNLNTNLK